MEKIYCCECGEDTEFDQGRMIWHSNVDDSCGHRYCIEIYDKKLKEKMAKEDNYLPPLCEKCDSELILSKTRKEEKGYRIDKNGEIILTFPKNLHEHSLVERLYCERCKNYYEVERDQRERIVVGKQIV